MTLPNQASSVTLTGNGATTIWDYDFIIPDAASARVGIFEIATGALTELAPSVYSITGLNNPAGGTVTYPLVGSPLAATHRIVIWREVAYEQTTVITNQTPYFPKALENQLDKIVMQIQQLSAEADRSLKVTLGSTLNPDQFITDLQAAEANAAASADAAAASAASASTQALPNPGVALNYVRRNAAQTAYESRTPAQAFADLAGSVAALTAAEQGQARANIGADLLSGFRNKIINGDFDVWQRGTTFASISNGAFSADRWKAIFDGTGVHNMSRGTLAPGQTDILGEPEYLLNFYQSSAGSGATTNRLEYRIEDVRTFAGKRVTLTFYAFATSPTSNTTITTNGRQNFGTGGTPSGEVAFGGSIVLNLTTTPQRFNVVMDVPSIASKSKGSNNDDYLAIAFNMPLNAITSVNFSHVSLVEGDATAEADPFSPRHIQQELALCQRYYELWYSVLSLGSAQNPFILYVPFKVTKRAVPTIVRTGNWYTGAESGTTVASAYENGIVISNSTGTGVGGQGTADAEL